jgi:hypothetical protein
MKRNNNYKNNIIKNGDNKNINVIVIVMIVTANKK